MKVAVREVLFEDCESIASIHVSSWKAAFRGLMPKGYIDSFTVTQRMFQWSQILKENLESVIVAEANGRVVGFLSYNIDATTEINKFYLCPSVYRQGVGSLLLSSLYTKAVDGCSGVVSLYVLDCNESAIRFYQKQGFEGTGESIATHYDDVVIVDVQMVKRLVI